MDATGTQTTLSDLKATTFTQQQVAGRYAYVVELYLGVAVCKHRNVTVGAHSKHR